MTNFTESQRMFDSLFNKIIVLLVVILFGKILYTGITTQFQLSSVFSLSILILAILIFVVFQLKTNVSSEGISVNITPFGVYKKDFNWNEIKKVEVVQYSALKEYGGWGYRRGRNGTAINPSGDNGLKLHFKDGKSLLIGTQKPEELKQFLKSIKK